MYSEKLKQAKQTVDQKIILAVLNAGTDAELRKLIEKYHIHLDVAEEAFSVLMLMCYGVISSSECFNIINDMHVVKTDDFANFIMDINLHVLKTIQEKIRYNVVNIENEVQQKYDDKLINPTPEDIQQSVAEVVEENEETAEEILARIEKEANDEVDEEMRQRQELEAKKEAEIKEVEDLRLAEEKKIEEEAGKEFDAMPAVNILDEEFEENGETEANITQDATNKQMAQTQNYITADLDLDMIPKTPVSTYIHTNDGIHDEPTEVLSSTEIVATPVTSVPTDKPQTSLDFIQSKASGNIASTTEKATPAQNQDLKNYMKDPYHEEL